MGQHPNKWRGNLRRTLDRKGPIVPIKPRAARGSLTQAEARERRNERQRIWYEGLTRKQKEERGRKDRERYYGRGRPPASKTARAIRSRQLYAAAKEAKTLSNGAGTTPAWIDDLNLCPKCGFNIQGLKIALELLKGKTAQ
jgi:hypothetical protein